MNLFFCHDHEIFYDVTVFQSQVTPVTCCKLIQFSFYRTRECEYRPIDWSNLVPYLKFFFSYMYKFIMVPLHFIYLSLPALSFVSET